jgi:hypothetical protein
LRKPAVSGAPHSPELAEYMVTLIASNSTIAMRVVKGLFK